METGVRLGMTEGYELFKIDLIVWIQSHPRISSHYIPEFKIDLIVWKHRKSAS